MVDWGMGVADPRAFYQGNEYVNRLYDMQAQKAAGAKIVSGDLRGAAGDLAGRGDVNGALGLTQQATADARTAKLDAQSDADRQALQFKSQHEYLQRAVPVLTKILQTAGPQKLMEAYGQLSQELQQMGIPPEAIAQYGQAFQRDPQGTLQALAATAQRKFHFVKDGNKTYVLDEADPSKPVATFEGAPDVPSGYAPAPNGGGLTFIPGGPADPANKVSSPPSGYAPAPGGAGLSFTPGGPADPDVIRRNANAGAEARREVIIQNPVAPQANPRQAQQMSVQLRKEFNQLPDVKAFNDVANSFEIINDIATRANAAEKSGGKPSAADDMSMIFAYMKMLDPGSVVREGEFANAQNTAGIPDQVRNAYNRALNGNRLNAKQRTDFSNTAKGVYQSRQKRYEQLVREYKGYATDSGLDEDTISARVGAGDGAPQSQGVVQPDVDALVGKYLGGR